MEQEQAEGTPSLPENSILSLREQQYLSAEEQEELAGIRREKAVRTERIKELESELEELRTRHAELGKKIEALENEAAASPEEEEEIPQEAPVPEEVVPEAPALPEEQDRGHKTKEDTPKKEPFFKKLGKRLGRFFRTAGRAGAKTMVIGGLAAAHLRDNPPQERMPFRPEDPVVYYALPENGQKVYEFFSSRERAVPAYVLVDKHGMAAYVMEHNKLASLFPVVAGREVGERTNDIIMGESAAEHTGEHATTEAGCYYLEDNVLDEYKKPYHGKILNIRGGHGKAFHAPSDDIRDETMAALASETAEDNHLSSGCIRVASESFEIVRELYGKYGRMPLVILPDDPHASFEITY